MKWVVNAVTWSQWHGGTLRETFTNDGVQPVVNSVLMFPQQLHNWVVGPAEDTVKSDNTDNTDDAKSETAVG